MTATEVLSPHGTRNDTYVDITPVVARKLIESWNGECGRAAGVNFAEAFCRYYHAPAVDPVTRHVEYSRVDLRAEFPC